MAYVHPASVEHERKRRMRPDAHLWIRQDAHRFMAPGAPRYVGKDVVRYFWPEYPTQPAHARGVDGAQSGDSEHAASSPPGERTCRGCGANSRRLRPS